MYVADDLSRLNDYAIEAECANPEDHVCDYCNLPSVESLPVYNPADKLRGVEGAYMILHLCNTHYNDQIYLETCFYCDSCGELFVQNHSWDFLAVVTDGGIYCQSCYAQETKPILLSELIYYLRVGITSNWKRLETIPDTEELWSGEFSQWGDFPGYTHLPTVAVDILSAAWDKGLTEESLVYPIITHTYQFSLVLEVRYK